MIPAILLALGGTALAKTGGDMAVAVGQNFVASAGEGALAQVVAKLTPEGNGDLRNLAVAALRFAAREGRAWNEGAVGEAWRAVGDAAETMVPSEGSRDFAPLARACVGGEPGSIRDALVPLLTRVPGFPTLADDDRTRFLIEIGPRFRHGFADRMKTEQHERGFKAFLRDGLWALREAPPGLLAEPLRAALAATPEVPDLDGALDRIAQHAKTVADAATALLEEIKGFRVDLNRAALGYQVALEAKEELIREKEAANRGLESALQRERVFADELREAGAEHRHTILLLRDDAAQKAEDYRQNLDRLEGRIQEAQNEAQRRLAERDEALAALAAREPEAVRRLAAERERTEGPQAASDVFLEGETAAAAQAGEYALDRAEVWLRDTRLDPATEAWRRVMERYPAANPLRTVQVGNALSAAWWRAGRYGPGLETARVSHPYASGFLGPEHPDTLTSANNLAFLYEDTGRRAEAEPLYVSTLEALRRTLGPEHPDTLTSANNLAGLYEATGRRAEAEPLYVSTLEALRRTLGPEHPDTLTSANNLAGLYGATGRRAEAEPLYVSTLEARRRTLGPEHPDTLTSANNLAFLYGATGRRAEAEPLYVSTLEARRRTLGPEHPDTLTSANNLAGLYEATGRRAEAEPLYVSTLEALRRTLGPEHPDTLKSANNLAGLYGATGRRAEAEPLYVSTLEARRRTLGPEHPDTLTSANNLAFLYGATGRRAEAEPLYVSTLEALRRTLGPEHPDTLTSANNLAVLLFNTGRREEARALLRSIRDAALRLHEGDDVRRQILANLGAAGT